MAAKRKRNELMSFTALKTMCDALPPMTIEEYREQAINDTIGIASDEILLASKEVKETRRRFIRDSFPTVDNPMLKREYEAYLATLKEIGRQSGRNR